MVVLQEVCSYLLAITRQSASVTWEVLKLIGILVFRKFLKFHNLICRKLNKYCYMNNFTQQYENITVRMFGWRKEDCRCGGASGLPTIPDTPPPTLTTPPLLLLLLLLLTFVEKDILTHVNYKIKIRCLSNLWCISFFPPGNSTAYVTKMSRALYSYLKWLDLCTAFYQCNQRNVITDAVS